eukprot:3371777-Rhodomonas_salina.2
MHTTGADGEGGGGDQAPRAASWTCSSSTSKAKSAPPSFLLPFPFLLPALALLHRSSAALPPCSPLTTSPPWPHHRVALWQEGDARRRGGGGGVGGARGSGARVRELSSRRRAGRRAPPPLPPP